MTADGKMNSQDDGGGRHWGTSRALDGGRVRELREAMGMTQAELRTRADLSRETIGQIESGVHYAKPDTRNRLAKALGVAPETLLLGWASRGEARPQTAPPVLLGPYLSRLPAAAGPLFGREKELDLLTAARESSSLSTVQLEAEGGAGKTALLATWLDAVRERDRHVRLYDYSFNAAGASAGASAEAMLGHAYVAFSLGDPSGVSAEAKCDALVSAIAARPTVVALDGMEGLQSPPGDANEGRIADPNLRSFVRRLAQVGVESGSLLVLTTRLRLYDLRQWEGSRVVRHELSALTRDSAAAVLDSHGVRGRESDVLTPVFAYTRGHALTLHLLAGYIESRFAGDGRAWREHGELTKVPRAGVDAKWVMARYEGWFTEEPEKLQLLRVVSLFDGAVALDDLNALLKDPPIRGLTDRLKAVPSRERAALVSQLTRARLLIADEGGGIDMHVVVRDYFRTSLRTKHAAVWRRANLWLSEHLAGQSRVPPRSPEDVLANYGAIKHASRAGDVRQAYRLYANPSIVPDRESIVRDAGLFAEDLSTLYAFFDLENGTPSDQLNDSQRIDVTERAASRLRWLGRLGDSSRWMRWLLDNYGDGKQERQSINVAARYVAECQLLSGELRAAEKSAREAIHTAKRGNWIDKAAALTIHGAALHQLGDLDLAEADFQKAEALQLEELPGDPRLNSVRANRYHDLLLDLNRFDEVIERSESLLQPLLRKRLHALDIGPVDQGCAHLSLGLARLRGGKGTADDVREQLTLALGKFNDSGRREFIYLGQIARSEFLIATRDYDEAVRQLEAVRYECEQDEMRRLMVDIDLLLAHAFGLSGRRADALERLSEADRRIKRFAYRRRTKRLEELRLKIAAKTLLPEPRF